MEETWTISELAEHAAAAVAADGSAQVSGRVRDLPNERLIRWYTTIGLVDPPLGRRGRTALYGPRHLLQLVAVKRRQAAGRSIAEIQLELAAATNETLKRIAALPSQPAQPDIRPALTEKSANRPTQHATTPDETDAQAAHTGSDLGESAPATVATQDDRPIHSPGSPVAPAHPAAIPAGSATSADEPSSAAVTATSSNSPYTAEPSTPPGTPAEDPAENPASQEARPTREGFWSTRPDVSYRPAAVSDDYGKPPPPVVQGIRLAPGLTLLLDVPTVSGDDLAAVQDAARPLLEELRRRGLLTPPESPAPQPVDPSRRSQ